MKRTLPVLCLLLAASMTHAADAPDQLFQQGNMLYQQGRLNEARSTYESLVNQGYVGGELYYNLGNVYYRTGDNARAILSYERALRFIPQDEDLRHNLTLANLRVADRIEATPRLFLWDYWDGARTAFSLTGLTWLTYLAYAVVCLLMMLFVLGRSYAVKRAGLIGALVAGVFLLALLTMMISRVVDLGASDEAVLMPQIVTVKNSPDTGSSDAFVLHAGVKVAIVDRVSEWVKIRLADGKVGWIERNAVEVI